MRKFYLTVAALTLLSTPVYSEGTLIIDDGQESIITGEIKNIRFDNLIMEVNGKEITVDVDALNIEDSIDQYFPIGTNVRIIGELEDDDEFNANKIMKINSTDDTDIIVTD